MRRAGIVVAAVLAFVALTGGAARANTVSASCTLTDLAPVACDTWHAADVTLRWSWTPGGESNTDGCGTATFTSDTPSPGASRTCTVSWGGMFAGSTATVSIDKTAPTVTSATPDRPPDYNGWYNHPVAFGFGGTDSPSGIAACDTVSYAGPDSAGASVSGSCRDRAGNRASGTFPLEYDATPPAPPRVLVAPGNRSIHLSWIASSDTTNVRVMRASTPIYAGNGDQLTDGSLKNGTTYRYTVTALDQAGNPASASIDAAPTALSLRPLPGALAGKPPLLRWKKLRSARYYNVQVFRGRRKVLSAWPAAAQLQLKRTWRYRGHRYRLVPGVYRWYVWPGYGARAAHRYGKMLGKSTFRVTAAP